METGPNGCTCGHNGDCNCLFVASPVEQRATKPTHYKVICLSMYTEDVEQLKAKVAELKRRGWTKANMSQLVRLALSRLDVDMVDPTNLGVR